jgi:hypothetical protein
MLALEDPRIALVPNLPSDKKDERCDGFAVWHAGIRHATPPKVDTEATPKVGLYIGDVHPLFIIFE